MLKKLPLLGLWLIGTPVLFLWSFQMMSSPELAERINKYVSPEVEISTARVFSALPSGGGEISFSVQGGDARELILQEYLQQLDSPLSDHTDALISAADTYNLDFRLLVAIARQESNLCRFIPVGGYNCWGWGIHERGTLGFSSYPQAIWTVSKGLREKYLDDGLQTPEQIMARYTPSSPGTWAMAVNQFMGEME